MGRNGSSAGVERSRERQGILRTDWGCPSPPGGRGNRARDTCEEQTAPAASAQAFAYIMTGSVS